jgi:hypothetical protein
MPPDIILTVPTGIGQRMLLPGLNGTLPAVMDGI